MDFVLNPGGTFYQIAFEVLNNFLRHTYILHNIYNVLFADGAPWASCRWFHKDRLQLTSLRHEQQNLFPIVRTGMGLLILGKLVFWQWYPFRTKTKN